METWRSARTARSGDRRRTAGENGAVRRPAPNSRRKRRGQETGAEQPEKTAACVVAGLPTVPRSVCCGAVSRPCHAPCVVAGLPTVPRRFAAGVPAAWRPGGRPGRRGRETGAEQPEKTARSGDRRRTAGEDGAVGRPAPNSRRKRRGQETGAEQPEKTARSGDRRRTPGENGAVRRPAPNTRRKRRGQETGAEHPEKTARSGDRRRTAGENGAVRRPAPNRNCVVAPSPPVSLLWRGLPTAPRRCASVVAGMAWPTKMVAPPGTAGAPLPRLCKKNEKTC